jgi:hypothetical protein
MMADSSTRAHIPHPSTKLHFQSQNNPSWKPLLVFQ